MTLVLTTNEHVTCLLSNMAACRHSAFRTVRWCPRYRLPQCPTRRLPASDLFHWSLHPPESRRRLESGGVSRLVTEARVDGGSRLEPPCQTPPRQSLTCSSHLLAFLVFQKYEIPRCCSKLIVGCPSKYFYVPCTNLTRLLERFFKQGFNKVRAAISDCL